MTAAAEPQAGAARSLLAAFGLLGGSRGRRGARSRRRASSAWRWPSGAPAGRGTTRPAPRAGASSSSSCRPWPRGREPRDAAARTALRVSSGCAGRSCSACQLCPSAAGPRAPPRGAPRTADVRDAAGARAGRTAAGSARSARGARRRVGEPRRRARVTPRTSVAGARGSAAGPPGRKLSAYSPRIDSATAVAWVARAAAAAPPRWPNARACTSAGNSVVSQPKPALKSSQSRRTPSSTSSA